MLEPPLPMKQTKRGRPRTLVLREVLNAMFYLVKTGCQWRNLPTDFPNYNSVYYYFRLFIRGQVWERIQRAWRYDDRHRQVRPVHPSAAIIDSQSVKTGARGG
jgi:putative transposase